MGTSELLGRRKAGAVESPTSPAPAAFELLEPRLLLSGDVLPGLDGDAPCAPPVEVTPEMLEELARGNNAFAFDLYQAVRDTPGSLFLSPFSVSAALSMTYAGAAGRTAEQMADVLHFMLPEELHHPAFGELIETLESGDGSTPPDYESGDAFTLNIANSLWGQDGEPFRQQFLDLIAESYGGPMYRTDFAGDTEGSRQRINQWVSDKTEEKIPELLHPPDITVETILVLVNALYFLGSWDSPFEEQQAGTFHLPEDDVSAEMMTQTHAFGYAEGADYQAVELPYVGDASMVVLLPRPGQFEAFEASLSATKVQAILGTLSDTEVDLTMPLFDFRTHIELQDVLETMGMTDAFNLALADFTRMTPIIPLAISKVIHEAYVSVDTEGTEAAAATAVVMFRGAPTESATMVVDRPFLFLIRDQATGTTLFVGRVSDASALIESEGPDPSPDVEAPIVVDVEVIQRSGQVVITFSEPVSIAGEAVLMTDSAGLAVDLADATLDQAAGGTTATLSFPERPAPGLYTLTLRRTRVQDRAANPLACGEEEVTGSDPEYPLLIAIPGDADTDGRVGALDYIALKRGVGQPGAAVWNKGDFDGDEAVGRSDLLALRAHFGQALAAPQPQPADSDQAALPEPASEEAIADRAPHTHDGAIPAAILPESAEPLADPTTQVEDSTEPIGALAVPIAQAIATAEAEPRPSALPAVADTPAARGAPAAPVAPATASSDPLDVLAVPRLEALELPI